MNVGSCYIYYDYKEMIVMALYDWNKDGKKNCVDDYIEYNIYKKCKNTDSYSSSGPGFFSILFIGYVILYVFVSIFGDACTPNPPCRDFECLEEQMDGSIYCEEHQYKDR